MYNPNDWELTLNGETFAALKSDFDAILRKTLTNMEAKDSELAELTVKLKITLKKDKFPYGEDFHRDVVMPKFEHKVSSVFQIKDELSGTLGGNYELVWDADRQEFVMREIRDGQTSFYDSGSYPQGGEVIDAIYKVAGMLPENVEEPQGCAKDYPDCLCLVCSRNSDVDENGSCCTVHNRDCKEMEVCPDYKQPDPYEYDEPEMEG